MKLQEFKKLIREEIFNIVEMGNYDASLLGPQIIQAAKDYAEDRKLKSRLSNREYDLVKNAFIAGILWKTKKQ